MYTILRKEKLAEAIWLMDIDAPYVVKNCLPGQFMILRIDENGERIPLTIADYDKESGVLTVVFQVVGASTLKLAEIEAGEDLYDVAGPLGNPSELTSEPIETLKQKKILFIAGGVGTAPVYPQVKWLHEQGVTPDVIVGARSKDLLFWLDKLEPICTLHTATDDGSFGFAGNVCACLEDLVNKGAHYDLCIAIGPCIMMKFACALTKKLELPTIVSMNPIMVDGTGMCGACRLTVGGKVKFACVDGPEFDGHLVDFDEVMMRQRIYQTEEGRAYLKAKEGATHHGGCGNCD